MLAFFPKRQQDQAKVAELCVQLTAALPATMLEKNRQFLSVNKVTRVIEQSVQAAAQHHLDSQMGFLRRSLFLNDLRWALRERGYPNDFISVLLEAVLLKVNQKKAPSP